jgi:IclR family transcriptional regulator, acetate operon repressor
MRGHDRAECRVRQSPVPFSGTTMRSSDDGTVLDRAFRLLSSFSAGQAELTLDELVVATGLPRSTAHRLARQLADHGALERTGRTWRLGIRMFEIGQLVPRQQALRDAALPYMEDLYELTHETVQLAVLDGSNVVYIEILSGHRKVPSPSRRGGRMPAYCTAVGKVLLAFSDDARRALPSAEARLPARTQNTITDVPALINELHDVRRSGLAFDREEAALGLTCVAAPVLIAGGRVLAALSVSMPAGKSLTPSRVAPAVRLAALTLSRQLNAALPDSVLPALASVSESRPD